jgi:predicted CopG family antitoxin
MKERMQAHPEVRWSNVIRVIIEKKLNNLELAEKLAKKSKISETDVKFLSGKVKKDMAKHAKRLLNESHS